MIPKSIKWDITGKCNLRCAHCSVGKTYFAGDVQEIPVSQKLDIIDKLVEGGVDGVSLLGGDPMVMEDDLFSVIDHAVSKGIKISIVTNGILLSGKVMERLADSGIERVVISLEGAGKESHEFVRGKNTFEKVVDNIGKLTTYLRKRNNPVKVSINTVLNRLNYSEIDKMIELCTQLEVNEWTLLSLGGIGFAEENINQLAITPEEEIKAARKIAQIYTSDKNLNGLTISPQFVYPLIWDYIEKEYGLKMPKLRTCCNASISLGYIGPDGNMYPCDRVSIGKYVGYNIDGAMVRPLSLVTHSFYDIWNSDYYMKMFDLILNDDTYKEYTPCNHCKYFETRYCNPCPLYSLDSKVTIKTCQLVEKKLGDISGLGNEESFVDQMLASGFWAHGEKEIRDAIPFNYISNKVPVRKTGIRSFKKNDHVILLNPYNVEFVGLNLIGKVIWDLIDGKNTVQDISSQITELAVEVGNTMSKEVDNVNLQPLLDKNISLFLGSLEDIGLIQLTHD